MKTILEPAREIPVTHEADLVVAGGGTAGIACAVCAARAGLKVVLIEQTAQAGTYHYYFHTCSIGCPDDTVIQGTVS